MGEELRPCPFCGSAPNVWLGSWRFDLTRVKMATCYGGNGKAHQPFSMPLATWQTRTDPGHIAAIREAREALGDLADAARSACDAKQHPPLTEALFDATAAITHLDTLLQTKGDDRGEG